MSKNIIVQLILGVCGCQNSHIRKEKILVNSKVADVVRSQRISVDIRTNVEEIPSQPEYKTSR